jgi:hypothetical protein
LKKFKIFLFFSLLQINILSLIIYFEVDSKVECHSCIYCNSSITLASQFTCFLNLPLNYFVYNIQLLSIKSVEKPSSKSWQYLLLYKNMWKLLIVRWIECFLIYYSSMQQIYIQESVAKLTLLLQKIYSISIIEFYL